MNFYEVMCSVIDNDAWIKHAVNNVWHTLMNWETGDLRRQVYAFPDSMS